MKHYNDNAGFNSETNLDLDLFGLCTLNLQLSSMVYIVIEYMAQGPVAGLTQSVCSEIKQMVNMKWKHKID